MNPNRFWLALAVVWTLCVTYALLSPSDGIPRWAFLALPGMDKLIHFGLFLVLAFAWNRTGILQAWPMFATLLAYAVCTELIQHFWLMGRQGSIADLAADALGSTLALGRSNLFRPARME